jgi:oligopeptidase A
MSDNPFLDPAFHIRWSALKAECVAPDITAVVRSAQAAIDLIAQRDPATLTFENSFLALEHATDALTVAWGKVTHLQAVADSPALRDAHNALLPRVSAFYAAIPLNAALWSRLKAFAESTDAAQVRGVHRRFLDETVKDFRAAGADLPAESRSRLEALQCELAQVTQKYSENVLDATNAWQLLIPEADEARLVGLPAHAKAAARRSAESKQLPGWRFTLHMPSLEPVLTYADDPTLRRAAWTASSRVGSQVPHDNTPLIRRILTLRAEKAALLGKAHFADLTLERRMAKSGANALEFTRTMQGHAAAAFRKECRELEAFKAQQTGQAPGPLAPWDLAYWAEKLRQAQYDFDSEVLRPYLPMDNVIAGLFEIVGRIFGLQVREIPAGQIEVWHPEVKCYELRDRAGGHLG